VENGSGIGTWMAYVAIVAFLLFLVFLLARTMMMFSTLTLMPLSRVIRWLQRVFSGRT
jgi:hypothetical protein